MAPPIVTIRHGETIVRFIGSTSIERRIDQARYLTGEEGSASAVQDGDDVVVILR